MIPVKSDLFISGIPVLENPVIPDGFWFLTRNDGPLDPPNGPVIYVGAAPISTSTWCEREALRIVHEGLAHVLEWLGEKPYRPPMSSREFLARLREEAR